MLRDPSKLVPSTESDLQALLEAAPDGVVIADENGIILMVNAQTESLFGYNRTELEGKSVEALVPERFRGRHINHRKEYSDSPHVRLMGAGRLYGLRKDGSEFPVEISLSPLRSDDGLLVFCAIRDVAGRKWRELRRSEAYLAEAQSLTHMGSWAWNPAADEMVHCSIEIYRIYGLDPSEGIPSFARLMQVVHPEDRDRVKQSTIEAIQQKAERLLEFRIVPAGGLVKYIESIRRPILDEAGNVSEILGTSIDVTERKCAMEAVQELQMELAHTTRVATMGHLTASIAHEVAQPISAALNDASAALHFLEATPPDLDEVKETLRCVVSDVDRARDILGRVRDYIKREPLHRRSFDLNEAVNEILAFARAELTKNGISLHKHFDDSLPLVEADRVQLQQVVLNLVLNAIEAMNALPEGPRGLSVRTSRGGSDEVIVTVSDTGPGIDRTRAERIFDAFYTTKPNGIGMGLSICRFIIAAHGGRLWMSANAPHGAVFQFAIPWKQVEHAGEVESIGGSG